MATLKQATSALLETTVIVPLAVANVARTIATTGVQTLEKTSVVTNNTLDGVIMGTEIALSEIELIKHRTVSENEAILEVEKEYFSTKDFKDKIKAKAMKRYEESEEKELTL